MITFMYAQEKISESIMNDGLAIERRGEKQEEII